MASFFSPTTWQGDRKAVARLPECGKCGLFRACHSPKMKPSGRGKRSILIVGEAPGEKEDEKGVQFVGKTGQFLRTELRGLGVELEDCYKTNSIICRPPRNKIENLHIASCRPNLLKTVRDLKPRVIVLLGASAVRSLLPAEREADVGSLARWVGWTIPSHEHQAWICPTYHPSYLLRVNDKVLERMFRGHLEQAVALEDVAITSEPLEALKKQVECITNPRVARDRVRDLAKQEGILAFDYESNRLKPDDKRCRIASCSFCLNGENTFAVLVDNKMKPMISEVLKNPRLKKVASNLKNEERWTRAILGHRVAGWYWDTMLAAHVLDNRKAITSLKFQAFIHFGIADYERVVAPYFQSGKDGFNRVHEVPVDDLLLYNGLDSLLEYRLMVLQRKQMGLKSENFQT